MLALLGSLKKATATGNVATNSLRFRASNSAYLSRTFATPTNSTVFTWSGWVKRGLLGGAYRLFGASTTTYLTFNSSDQLNLTLNGVSAATTTAVFRDPSSWYHVVYAQNGLSQTIYVNGLSVATGIVANTVFNTAIAHQISAANTSNYFDGYLTEVYFIDGQALTPSSFGQFDSTTGVWQPKQYTGTYGTNGFSLEFADASAATAAAIGKDTSGNGNNWTPNGISVTAGVTYDSMIDVPVNYSDGGNGRGNYAVLNAVDKNSLITTANANLTIGNSSAGSYGSIRNSINMTTGKWYMEFSVQALGAGGRTGCGLYTSTDPLNNFGGANSTSWAYHSTGFAYSNGLTTALSTGTYVVGDVIMMAFDADNGRLWFGKNGTWNGDPVAGTGNTYSSLTSAQFFFGGWAYNTSDITNANFGQRPFAYTPPTGFLALNTQNLPTPAIVNGANFMAATTYTGNATARSLSNAVNSVSFQPDLVWIKSRTPGATNHALFNSTRGTTKYLSSNTAGLETTNANTLTAFGADGFSLGTDTTLVNANANSYVAWQWKESVAAGLDVVTYSGTLTTGGTVAINHNLGVAPSLVISKSLTPAGADVGNWFVWHASAGTGNFLRLNTTDQANSISGAGGGTMIAPTSSVFYTPYVSGANVSGNNYVAYCFAEIAGFSRFGSYTGNGSADGPFVYCGFRPKFVMIKCSSTAGGSWVMYDSGRDQSNLSSAKLAANLGEIENGATVGNSTLGIDLLSNGFKNRNDGGVNHNSTGATYIFAAFAENPSKYALAR